MSRFITPFPFVAFSLIVFAGGCDRTDQLRTTSSSAGATPTVSAAKPETSEEAPITAPVSYEAAESAFSVGRYPEATELFTGYTRTHPDNPWGYYMLGMSAWRTGEPDMAVSAFDEALRLDPAHRKSLFNSSRVLLETGRPKDALGRIERALGLEPMSNEGLRLLGRARYELGDVEGAIQAYRRALSIDERDVWSMNNLGLIYIQTGRSSEAIAPLARAVELRGNSPVFQNNLGTALEKSGYPNAAAQAFEAAIAADSSYTKASAALARITSGSQQPESTAVDMSALSADFQARIGTWRTPEEGGDSLSTSVELESAPDTVSLDSRTDSILESGGPVSETHEECLTAEDL